MPQTFFALRTEQHAFEGFPRFAPSAARERARQIAPERRDLVSTGGRVEQDLQDFVAFLAPASITVASYFPTESLYE